jgi:hypothetical protein
MEVAMKRLTILLAAAVLLCTAGFAQIPHRISHQGFLTNAAGVPLTATPAMTFRLYTAVTGGSPVWSQFHPSVTVSNGVFNAVLDVSPVEFSTQYYIETEVAGNVLTPRRPLTSVPYALGPWSVVGSDLSYTAGNVGIGTTSPASRLQVGPGTPVFSGTDVNITSITNVASANNLLLLETRDAANDAGIVFATSAIPEDAAIFLDESDARKFKIAIGDVSGDGSRNTNTKMVIDQTGNVGIGTTTPESELHVNGLITCGDISAISESSGGVVRARLYSSAAITSQEAPLVGTFRARGTKAAPTAVQSGDHLGELQWGAQWGSVPGEQGLAASIRATATENWSSGAHGSAIEFATIDNGTAPYPSAPTRMKIDQNGNVGIGTTGPTAKLHVGGTAGVDGIKFPDGTLQTTAATGGGGSGWTDDGTTVRLTTSTDNVGIGTTSPASRLQVGPGTPVFSGTDVNITSITNVASANNLLLLETRDAANDVGIVFATSAIPEDAAIFLDESDARKFKIAIGDVSGDGSRNTNTKMVIDQTGNVGIGTTTPSAKLDIVHTGSTPNLQLKSRLSSIGDDIQVRNPGDNNLAFRTFYGSGLSTMGGYVLQGYRRYWDGGALILVGVCTDDQSTVDGAVIIRGQLNDAQDNLVNAPVLDVEKGDGTSLILVDANGNVGIGTTSPGTSNLLELSSTTKGLVLPRMTKSQRDAIASPVAGMMVYQTDNTPGLRVYNGTSWVRFTETVD